MSVLSHALCGLLLGLGLLLSGMLDPARVLAFLDLAGGAWDPSLAFTMLGAVLVTALGYRLAWRRGRPLLADRFQLPTARAIDARLVTGALVFGLGWGLAGLCPGPALAGLGLGAAGVLAFLPGMALGMALARRLARR
ncbi:DUF6691 family protein [Pseudoroseomonas cervicalis]|uniref:YeeE/YedE family protein n=1 Tax=Pseudoroseomonas cervicalis ATCC 49957 TaxID=525371 RepID=D5RJH6_9PROT|nr:DUF6691 family protein [Pseudoroseomonas cervicalis]EFH12542.1 YeeE/YedE family protein [Pseudoroseomonas cervicalis ATCC 49957]